MKLNVWFDSEVFDDGTAEPNKEAIGKMATTLAVAFGVATVDIEITEGTVTFSLNIVEDKRANAIRELLDWISLGSTNIER